MALDRATVRIVNAAISADAQVRSRVLAFIERTWTGLGSWRDRDIDRFVTAVTPVVLSGERQIAQLTNAYLAQFASSVLGAPFRPTSIDPATVSGAALRGVDPAEVYRRPGVTTWTALSNGKPLTDAVDEGLRRAVVIATTDMQLAKTHTARAVYRNDSRVVGHRRVLTGSENCGLCIVASTQRYHKSELQPIHPGCDCGESPIYGDRDPGQVIDPNTLEDVHDAIAARFGVSDASARDPIDYKDVLVVHEHGEVGPVLGIRSQHFAGPGDI